jgi:hypothetical protein
MLQARSAGSDALQRVVDAAHDAGTLRPDITTGTLESSSSGCPDRCPALPARGQRSPLAPSSRPARDRLRTRPGPPPKLSGPP